MTYPRLVFVIAAGALACSSPGFDAAARVQDAGTQAAKPASRIVGAITAINGNSLSVKTDSGTQAIVVVEDDARMVQTAPGQKDLTGATPIHLTDLQVGDRILARVSATDDGKYEANTVIVMKQSDIAAKQANERQDWQRRGAGGLVKSVDPAGQLVMIAVSEPGGSKTLAIHLTPTTVVRRYSPDSVKFDDATKSSLGEIKVGDQLRARGEKNADGSELTAEEIVSGTFKNVAATVVSVDSGAGTVTLNDLATKKPVVIRVTAESQCRKLPAMMAQGIAMRLKGGAATAGGSGNGTVAPGSSTAAGNGNAGAGAANAETIPGSHPHQNTQPRGTAGPNGPRRSGDMQQMLARAPEIHLPDLNKGDAVMVVATQGSDATPSTAITLLAGVEPMLQASTSASQSMMMASWNLNANGGQDAQQ